jgi:UDP-N-acetylmuramoyl-L-alanyl-D-glutamate--2,6-diaminopimelate ligase
VRLRELVAPLEILEVRGDLDVELGGLASHSGRVLQRDVFVAVPGTNLDGHVFLKEAAARGACAAVVERFQDSMPGTLTQVRVSDARKALAILAARFYGEPARDLRMVGITGTNGKTTTAHVLEAILGAAGHSVGILGTIAYRWGGRLLPAPNTTPDPLELQGLLARMRQEGVSHVVMEVTSHALEQKRVLGCRFQAGIFTNLTRDHLDYHGSMEAYLAAKLSLFRDHLRDEAEGGWALLNIQDPASMAIRDACRGRVAWYGMGAGADFQALEWKGGAEGTRIRLRFPQGEVLLESPLIGEPNVLNVVAACGCAWGLGVGPEKWEQGLRRLSPVPGRMERILVPGLDSGITALVDYAHTPDALQRALVTARKLARRRLIAVFGCGGDRDKGKRPMMASAAALHCDLAVVTSDNPRSEDPRAIIDQILEGFRGTRMRRISPMATGPTPAYTVLENREEAIRWAIGRAQDGDVVLIAGKGHETYQILRHATIPFDDREVARRALLERGS